MAKTKVKVLAPEHVLMERLYWGLRWLGMGALANDPPWLKIVLNVVMIALMTNFVLFQTIAAVMCKNISCIIANLADNLFCIMNVYTYVAFLLVYHLTDELMDKLKRIMAEFSTEEETVKMDKILNTVVRCYQIYLFCVTASFNVFPIIDYQDCLERNDSANIHSCGMPVASWYPWDETSTPGLQLTWLFQLLAGGLATGSSISSALLCFSHICHVYIQCKVLQKSLVAINDLDPSRRVPALKRCIQHHNAILDYGGKLADFFNKVNYAQQMIIALLIACVGYKLLEMVVITEVDPQSFFKYILEWFGIQMYLLLISTLGQELMDASTEIADVAYTLPWYESSKEFCTLLYIIIMRSRKPMVIKSANLTVVCRNSLVDLLRTIYSFLSVFATVLLKNKAE